MMAIKRKILSMALTLALVLGSLSGYHVTHAASSSPLIGVQGWWTYTGINLNKWLNLQVNVGSGNLVVNTDALNLPGVNGLNEAISPVYNNLSSDVLDMGHGWTMGTGNDVNLTFNSGTVTYRDQTGTSFDFAAQSDGSYASPDGMDGELVKNSDGTYTITMNSGGKYNFNSQGQLTSHENNSGNKITYSYSSGLLTEITNTEGQITTLTYDSNNTLSQIKDPNGRTWSYSYDSNGNLTTTTDPAGNKTTFTYDSNHNLTAITDPLNNKTLISYNSNSQVTDITRVTNSTDNSGASWNFTYSSGQTGVTDPTGSTTSYTYDSSGRVVQITNPAGKILKTQWTTDDQLSQQTDYTGASTTYNYDNSNNLTEVSNQSGVNYQYQYQDTNNPHNATATIDPKNNQTTYNYTSQGLLSTVQDAANHSTNLKYNTDGTIASITDPNGNVTAFNYNSQGLVNKITYPSPLGAVAIDYNSYNEISNSTDGKGQQTSYSYDVLGNITSITYADGSKITYAYDSDGNLTSMTDGNGTTTYAYNNLNQKTQEVHPDGSKVTYTYDGIDNMLSKTDSFGTTTYSYDSLNLLSSVTDPKGSKTTFTYNSNGQKSTVSYPNGVTETLTYNDSGQLSKIAATNSSGKTLTSYSYSFVDPSNGKTTDSVYSETDAAGNVTTYQYDSLNRLTQATQKDSTGSVINQYSYSYDNSGNMVSKTVNGTTTTMSYNGIDELTKVGSANYGFDANGNLTGSQVTNSIGNNFSNTYNAANQTTSMTGPATGTTQINDPYMMTYSGVGQSIRLSEGTNNFQYDDTGMSSMTTSTGTIHFTRTPDGQLISEQNGNGTYYYLFDGVGSVRALSDINGNLVDQYEYGPYGEFINDNETVFNPFKWLGQIYDKDTRLYKIGDRYYDPSVGRWTQRDPSGMANPSNPQTLNMYVYAQDNPINYKDTTGLYSIDWYWWGYKLLLSETQTQNLVWQLTGCGAVGAVYAELGYIPGVVAAAFGLGAWYVGYIDWIGGNRGDYFGHYYGTTIYWLWHR